MYKRRSQLVGGERGVLQIMKVAKDLEMKDMMDEDEDEDRWRRE